MSPSQVSSGDRSNVKELPGRHVPKKPPLAEQQRRFEVIPLLSTRAISSGEHSSHGGERTSKNEGVSLAQHASDDPTKQQDNIQLLQKSRRLTRNMQELENETQGFSCNNNSESTKLSPTLPPTEGRYPSPPLELVQNRISPLSELDACMIIKNKAIQNSRNITLGYNQRDRILQESLETYLNAVRFFDTQTWNDITIEDICLAAQCKILDLQSNLVLEHEKAFGCIDDLSRAIPTDEIHLPDQRNHRHIRKVVSPLLKTIEDYESDSTAWGIPFEKLCNIFTELQTDPDRNCIFSDIIGLARSLTGRSVTKNDGQKFKDMLNNSITRLEESMRKEYLCQTILLLGVGILQKTFLFGLKKQKSASLAPGNADNPMVIHSIPSFNIQNSNFNGLWEGLALRAALGVNEFYANDRNKEGENSLAIKDSMPEKLNSDLVEEEGHLKWINERDNGQTEDYDEEECFEETADQCPNETEVDFGSDEENKLSDVSRSDDGNVEAPANKNTGAPQYVLKKWARVSHLVRDNYYWNLRVNNGSGPNMWENEQEALKIVQKQQKCRHCWLASNMCGNHHHMHICFSGWSRHACMVCTFKGILCEVVNVTPSGIYYFQGLDKLKLPSFEVANVWAFMTQKDPQKEVQYANNIWLMRRRCFSCQLQTNWTSRQGDKPCNRQGRIGKQTDLSKIARKDLQACMHCESGRKSVGITYDRCNVVWSDPNTHSLYLLELLWEDEVDQSFPEIAKHRFPLYGNDGLTPEEIQRKSHLICKLDEPQVSTRAAKVNPPVPPEGYRTKSLRLSSPASPARRSRYNFPPRNRINHSTGPLQPSIAANPGALQTSGANARRSLFTPPPEYRQFQPNGLADVNRKNRRSRSVSRGRRNIQTNIQTNIHTDTDNRRRRSTVSESHGYPKCSPAGDYYRPGRQKYIDRSRSPNQFGDSRIISGHRNTNHMHQHHYFNDQRAYSPRHNSENPRLEERSNRFSGIPNRERSPLTSKNNHSMMLNNGTGINGYRGVR